MSALQYGPEYHTGEEVALNDIKSQKPIESNIANVASSMTRQLVRICAHSLILSLGYAINAVSHFTHSKPGIWQNVYATFSLLLFITYLVMVFVALFAYQITILSAHNRAIAIYLFTVCAGYITSLMLAILFSQNNEHFLWHYEVLHALLPLYVACMTYFFNNARFTQPLNLIFFSLVLFITSFVRLLVTITSTNDIVFVYDIAPYLSICAATSILILLHIMFLYLHYNSGLFLKSCIICLLLFSVIVSGKTGLGKSESIASLKIYYFYILSAALFIIYCCELFIKGSARIVRVDARSLAKSPSINIAIESAPMYLSRPPSAINFVEYPNLNDTIASVMKIFADFKPCAENGHKYFDQLVIDDIKHGKLAKKIDRLTDSIAVIVPFYNEKASEIHATLRSLYFNFEYIKKKESRYKFTHFNVLLVSDGWFKADISTKRYLAKLYNCECSADCNINQFNEEKHKTVILQTKFNQKLCINPFNSEGKKLWLKLTTIIKIDNRKKANSHEWFLGKYGFAEWCKCDYMFFTDAYSTMNREGLYQMMQHMKKAKNQDVVCCTGRARIYSMSQELGLRNFIAQNDTINIANLDSVVGYEYDETGKRWWQSPIFLSDEKSDVKENSAEIIKKIEGSAQLRACQTFEFEALYGTIGCFLLGGFLPVIPGPCGFYRSSYLLEDEVRGWYFEQINEKNDAQNVDLVLGNMKLAEDRILTIASILKCKLPVRHSLIPECIFYFDPQPNLTQLMKQRRRWLNGSVATVLFVLQRISFSQWKVNPFRRFYVLSLWYMQLLMYIMLALSPPLIFTISFEYGLEAILDAIGYDSHKDKIITLCMIVSWCMYLVFIYFVSSGQSEIKRIKRERMVQLTFVISYLFGLLTLIGTLMQLIDVISSNMDTLLRNPFNFAVVFIQMTFILQSFVLAPFVSKDIKTLTKLLKSSFHYFLCSPFYVSFMFINACANIDDLSWGTRPDGVNEERYNNPKRTTIKLLSAIILLDVIIALAIQPLTEHVHLRIIFFSLLVAPSLYQIFFSIVWLLKTRFTDLWNLCKPKKMNDKFQYMLV